MRIVNRRNASSAGSSLKVGSEASRRLPARRAHDGGAAAGASRQSAARSPRRRSAAARGGRVSAGLFRAAIDELVPYEPGKPVEEVQRELGLERVVKLASNEGPFPPFPAALEAIAARGARPEPLSRRRRRGRCARRSPSGTASRSRRSSSAPARTASSTCCRRRRSTPATRSSAAGRRSRATCSTRAKLGAVARKVPLRDHTYDLDALLAAIGPRTKLVYVCHPNNPTGTANGRAELIAFLDRRARARARRARPGVLRVHRRSRLRRRDRGATSSAGPPRRRAAHVLEDLRARRAARRLRRRAGGRRRRRRARCGARSTSAATAQAAALASLGDEAEIARRRALERRRARAARARSSARTGSSRRGPALGNFLYAEVGDGARAVRAAAAPGRDRPAARRLRRAGGDPRHASARRRRTRSSLPRSDTSFRASRNRRRTVLASGALVRGPRAGSWRPLRLAGFRLLFLVDARVERRHAAGGDRARDRRQGPDELGPLGRRRCSSSSSCRRSRSASCSARCSTGSSAGALMVAADLVRVGVFVALPFATSAAQIVALALVAGLATASSGRRSTRACRTSSPDERSAAGERAPADRRERRAGRSARCVGGLLDRRRGPDTPRTGSTPCRSSSRPRSSRASPRACCRARRALTRGHWRDLADGFARRCASRPLLAVLVAWGIASLGIGAINVSEVFLAKNTLPRRRLRLRPAVRRHRRRARARELLEQRGSSSAIGVARATAARSA